MMMKLIVFILIVMKLICTATTAPVDRVNYISTRAVGEVKIPPYIRKIYKKMSQAMQQDDVHTRTKFLKTIRAVHWLVPVTHDATVVSTEPYKYQYTLTFNVGRLSHKKHHPNYAELFLHILTDDHSPAQIKIVSNHLQQPITWTKLALQANGSETAEVRIHLTSLANSSLWHNGTTLTITVASTNTIRIPSENHHQTALGLVLYMGGAPEVIDELLETPIADHTLKQMDSNKRSTTGSTPCQLKKGFKVKFADVKYGYDKILQPEEVDIGRCVGECPHLLHHLHNPTDHATVRNILAFLEGSGETNISTASCVPTTFKPLPVVVFNSNGITQKVMHKMVANSCGCR